MHLAARHGPACSRNNGRLDHVLGHDAETSARATRSPARAPAVCAMTELSASESPRFSSRLSYKWTMLTENRAAQKYSTKIIKAGALLDDTRTLFAHWDVSAGRAANLERLRDQNVFGKTSRMRVENVL